MLDLARDIIGTQPILATFLAIGLGYSKIETNLQVFDTDQPLRFDLDTSGPEIFFRASF